MSKNTAIYEVITKKVIEQLENAIKTGERFRWIKGWNSGMLPTGNFISYLGNDFRPYRGINQLLLSELYITYNQLMDFQKKHPEKEFKIRKGCHKETVYFYKLNEVKVENEEGEEEVRVLPLMRFYSVFSYKDIEGLDEFVKVEEFEHDFTENMRKADSVIENYCERDGLDFQIVEKSDRCFYRPSTHMVNVPPAKQFKSASEYYSSILHELVHSTSKKLGRDVANGFGSEDYSFEELIAELGAAMLMSILGIADDKTFENSTAYLQGWLKKIKDSDPSFIVKAANAAQKACDYILGTEEIDSEARIA